MRASFRGRLNFIMIKKLSEKIEFGMGSSRIVISLGMPRKRSWQEYQGKRLGISLVLAMACMISSTIMKMLP